MKRIALSLVCLVCAIHPALAIETAAQQAFLIDMTTHSVLMNKDGDVQMHPSSMSKLMTMYILFDRLKSGRVKLTDKFPISEKAWRTQGSKTFVAVGQEISVEELIHGIVIQSGNDACIVVAEGLSGSEDAFAKEMNRMGEKLGLKKSHFVNATGMPDDGHLMSARDLATLAEHIITDFPEYYHYFSQQEYTYNNITQHNRNRLLGSTIGVDGLKTGHTEAGGFGITLSAQQNGRRLILVINGMKSDNERVAEGDKLMRWGFREFENKQIVRKGVKVDDADVWFGREDKVPLVTEQDVLVTMPISQEGGVTYTLKYNSPIPAPVEKGVHIADLVIGIPGEEAHTVPLVAGESIDKLSGIGRMIAVLRHRLSHRQ